MLCCCLAAMGARAQNPEKQALQERFLRYQKIPAVSSYDRTITDGQLKMAETLCREASRFKGVKVSARQGYVSLYLPSNVEDDSLSVLFTAHLDTTPEAPAPGPEFVPQIIESYAGGPLVFDARKNIVILPEEEPSLARCVGHTLVTADGASYLGGDCRAGVAVVMQLFEKLSSDPEIRHGEVYGLICPNEEIGKAADGIEWNGPVPDLVYDLDGGGSEIVSSNFTACGYTLRFEGNLEHPSYGAENGLADALNAAARFVAGLPVATTPENSRGRSGYIHPFKLEMRDGGATAEVEVRVRYFSEEEGQLLKNLVEASLAQVAVTNPRVKVEKSYREQYANVERTMHPECVNRALSAYRACGMADVAPQSLRAGVTAAMFPIHSPLRGGVCLGVGQHREHSVREYLDVDEMTGTYRVAMQIVRDAVN